MSPRPPGWPRASPLRADAFEGGLDLRDRRRVWRGLSVDERLKLRTGYAADARDPLNTSRLDGRA
jgi:hypothetical protein